MLFQFPEHWINILGKRIQNVHLKEFTKKGTDHSLESFRPLLDGTTNWPAVIEAFDSDRLPRLLDVRVLPPLPALSRALIFQTSIRWIGCWGGRHTNPKRKRGRHTHVAASLRDADASLGETRLAVC